MAVKVPDVTPLKESPVDQPKTVGTLGNAGEMLSCLGFLQEMTGQSPVPPSQQQVHRILRETLFQLTRTERSLRTAPEQPPEL